MKCPNCGAEVRANTECKYCGSFVERAHKIKNTSSHESDKKTGKAVMWSIIIIGAVFLFGTISLLLFSGLTLFASFRFNEWLMEPSSVELEAVQNIEGNVTSFDYDGTVTVEYNMQAFSTKILDQDLLNWLKDTGRSIEGINILFSTNEDCEITDIALSSNTFYVIKEEKDGYIVIRDDTVFFTTADEKLDVGCYYSSYMRYPTPHMKKAKGDSAIQQLLFSPTCTGKREVAVTDYYSGDNISLYQVEIDQIWYYCSQELYDACQEDTEVTFYLYVNNDMNVACTDH